MVGQTIPEEHPDSVLESADEEMFVGSSSGDDGSVVLFGNVVAVLY